VTLPLNELVTLLGALALVLTSMRGLVRAVTEAVAVFCRSDKPSKRLAQIRRRSPEQGD
jgi:hypothetical protein